jgi:hypothetical protein
MRRVGMCLSLGVVVFAAAGLGCQLTEDKALKPLATEAPPPGYEELFKRAKAQVWSAQEQFFRDNWDEVTRMSDLIEQSGSLFAKVKEEDAPARVRPVLVKQSKELTDAAVELRSAAKAKDASKGSAAFQRLHLALKELRAE